MPKVTIYSTAMCPYCVRAKMLLSNKGVSFEEIRVDLDHSELQTMLQRSGRRTVPQIFIDDQHVGGFDDLALLDSYGKLDPMLGLDSQDDIHGYGHAADESEDGPT